jgi:hypothetical protein
MTSEVRGSNEQGDTECDRQGGLQSRVVLGSSQWRPAPDGEGKQADHGLAGDESDGEGGSVEPTSSTGEDDEHGSEREGAGCRNQCEEQDAKRDVGRWR